jgi:hypothetical protein
MLAMLLLILGGVLQEIWEAGERPNLLARAAAANPFTSKYFFWISPDYFINRKPRSD